MVIVSSVSLTVLSVHAALQWKIFQKKIFKKNFYLPYFGYAGHTDEVCFAHCHLHGLQSMIFSFLTKKISLLFVFYQSLSKFQKLNSSQFCNPRPRRRALNCNPDTFCTISRELSTECLFYIFDVKQTQVFVLGRECNKIDISIAISVHLQSQKLFT